MCGKVVFIFCVGRCLSGTVVVAVTAMATDVTVAHVTTIRVSCAHLIHVTVTHATLSRSSFGVRRFGDSVTYGALAWLRTAPRRGVERERGSGATKQNDKKTRTLLHHRPARQRRREPLDTTPAIATRPPRAPRASTCRAALRSIKNARRVTWRVRASERAQPRARERRSIRSCAR